MLAAMARFGARWLPLLAQPTSVHEAADRSPEAAHTHQDTKAHLQGTLQRRSWGVQV